MLEVKYILNTTAISDGLTSLGFGLGKSETTTMIFQPKENKAPSRLNDNINLNLFVKKNYRYVWKNINEME